MYTWCVAVYVGANWSKGFGNENNSKHGFGYVWLCTVIVLSCVCVRARVIYVERREKGPRGKEDVARRERRSNTRKDDEGCSKGAVAMKLLLLVCIMWYNLVDLVEFLTVRNWCCNWLIKVYVLKIDLY